MTPKRWDLFCKIVDNFGDIGICWRLARQLAAEYGLAVRLYIDDFQVASQLIGTLEHTDAIQTIDSIEIAPWAAADHSLPAPVVLETFGCGLPAAYLEKMAQAHVQWINIEYLSAEPWVDDFHARSSPQPALNLVKYFFFPGFSEQSGGLIREQSLLTQRDAFQKDTRLQQDFWQSIGVNSDGAGDSVADAPLKVSLFGYPQADVQSLFSALSQADFKTKLFIPASSLLPACKNIYPQFAFTPGSVHVAGQLTLHILPFLSQQDYDRLLWACDLNFVRGEDSWIRAIWAGKPLIWQPYIQTENTHIAKLDAFLQAYSAAAPAALQAVIRDVHHAWSNAGNIASATAFKTLFAKLPMLGEYAKAQCTRWERQADLAAKLVIFSEKIEQNRV